MILGFNPKVRHYRCVRSSMYPKKTAIYIGTSVVLDVPASCAKRKTTHLIYFVANNKDSSDHNLSVLVGL